MQMERAGGGCLMTRSEHAFLPKRLTQTHECRWVLMLMEGRAGRAWNHQWAKVQVCNYHLLRAAFGQGVAVA